MAAIKIGTNKYDMEFLALDFCLAYGMISGYVEHLGVWKKLLIAIFVIIVCSSQRIRNSIIKNKTLLSLLGVSAILLLLNIFKTNGSFDIAMKNIDAIIGPLIIGLIFVGANHDKKMTAKYLSSRFMVLNIWWLINIIVLSIQISGYSIFIKPQWLAKNSFYQDLCCGLFGYNRSHVLSLYACTMFFYNFIIIRQIRFPIKKRIYTFINYAETIVFFICSARNDNYAVFLIIPIYAVLFAMGEYIKYTNSISQKVARLFKFIFCMSLIAAAIYMLPGVSDFLYNVLLSRFDRIINYNNYSISGGNERMAIIQYALERGHGWKLGTGIGSWGLEKINGFGYVHYGLNSISSFINQMGVAFFCVHCAIFFCFYKCQVHNQQLSDSLLFSGLVVFCIIMLTIYTVAFTSEAHAVWIYVIFLIFGFEYPHAYKKMKKVKHNEKNRNSNIIR